MAHTRKLGVNPLPWVLTETGFNLSEATLRPALSDLREAGYSALHADIPEGMSVESYVSLLSEYGFSPAPGYFSADFQNRDEHAHIAEQAKEHAEKLAALGLTETFVANNLVPGRIGTPALGKGHDAETVKIVAEGIAKSADAAAPVGVRQALHPHVGSLVETEEEVRAILDATSGSSLGFGPDVGHLTWAGVDAPTIIRDYADRVLALHVKDVDKNAVQAAKAAGADYLVATLQHHVWTEPGRGSVNFDAVLAALPEAFDGWFVVEVDVPNMPSALESNRAARDYLLALPSFQAVTA